MNNHVMTKNVLGSFLIRGLGMILSLFTLPAYMRYFNDIVVLGVWFTMASILSWILIFDLGIGNGLRNKLPKALVQRNVQEARGYISSSYVLMALFSFVIGLIYFLVQPYVNWNVIFKVSTQVIPEKTMHLCMNISISGMLIQLVLSITTGIIYAAQMPAVNSLNQLASSLMLFIYVSLSKDKGTAINMVRLSCANAICGNLPLCVSAVFLFAKPFRHMRPSFRAFSIKTSGEVLQIGLTLLLLQWIWMFISLTHVFLINRFIGLKAVVEYHIYSRLYNAVSSMIALAIAPIWSAVTKAQADQNSAWIKHLCKVAYVPVAIAATAYVLMYPFMQQIMDLWIGQGSLQVDYGILIIMSVVGVLTVLHMVNTSIANGLSLFKEQKIYLLVGAVAFLPVTWLLCRQTQSWTGVMVAFCLCISPYELLQIRAIRHHLSRHRSKPENTTYSAH